MLLSMGSIGYAKTGDVIGYALQTDIVAEINGAQIPSYNVDGYTYIVAEDLADYGFNVKWDAKDRMLEITRKYSVRDIYTTYKKPYVSKSNVGKRAHNILETDIYASLSRYYIYYYDVYEEWEKAYNINGRTIIPFDRLDIFGNVKWDPNARKISLDIPGVNNAGGSQKTSWDIKNDYSNRATVIEVESYKRGQTAFTQLEMNMSSGLEYRTWDVLLNEIYQYLRTYLPAGEFEKLKQEQIKWISEKENAIEAERNGYGSGSIAPLMANSTGTRYTKERCYYLMSLIK